jgi:hypothetical protein
MLPVDIGNPRNSTDYAPKSFWMLLVHFISDQDECITLFRPIAVFCGTDNIMWNIPQMQAECEEYFVEYYHSHKTLLWV